MTRDCVADVMCTSLRDCLCGMPESALSIVTAAC